MSLRDLVGALIKESSCDDHREWCVLSSQESTKHGRSYGRPRPKERERNGNGPRSIETLATL